MYLLRAQGVRPGGPVKYLRIGSHEAEDDCTYQAKPSYLDPLKLQTLQHSIKDNNHNIKRHNNSSSLHALAGYILLFFDLQEKGKAKQRGPEGVQAWHQRRILKQRLKVARRSTSSPTGDLGPPALSPSSPAPSLTPGSSPASLERCGGTNHRRPRHEHDDAEAGRSHRCSSSRPRRSCRHERPGLQLGQDRRCCSSARGSWSWHCGRSSERRPRRRPVQLLRRFQRYQATPSFYFIHKDTHAVC